MLIAPRLSQSRTAPLPLLCSLLLVTACDFGGVNVIDPPAPPTITVTFTLRREEDAAGQALGWSNAAIPGAQVVIASTDSTRPWSVEGTSDASGNFVAADVAPGSYRITAHRLLSEQERARAASTGINAFTMVTTITLSQSGSTEVRLPASRTEGLVISEYHYPSSLNLSGTCCYEVGGFVELYNNADTTIHLDGKVIGRAFSRLIEISNRPCSMFEALRVDPLGLWSFMFEKFPGTGSQYPLLPGKTVVAATDAIDHRPFASDALDLTAADFEFRGPSDVNNPAVPDMVNRGLLQPPDGHGFRLPGIGYLFVAAPFDPSSLPRGREPDSQLEYMRIPAGHVLDTFLVSSEDDPTFVHCATLSHPSFNRGYAPFPDARNGALHRKALYTRPDGRVVLQNTRNSEADWLAGTRSPGVIGPGR